MFSVGQHDYQIAQDMLVAMGADLSVPERRLLVAIPGPPLSKNRARFVGSGGRPYTPKTTRDEELRVASYFRGVEPFVKNVAVSCLFYRPNRVKIDTDNMVKMVMDAMTKAEVWPDDYLVTAIAARTELDQCNPRTIVAVAHHESSLERGTNMDKECVVCGKTFRPSDRLQDACSRKCGKPASSSKMFSRDCEWCRETFHTRGRDKKFCTDKCKYASSAAKRAEKRLRGSV